MTCPKFLLACLAFLIGELALDDFDAAMRYIRPMPDSPAKVMALLAVVQLLQQRY